MLKPFQEVHLWPVPSVVGSSLASQAAVPLRLPPGPFELPSAAPACSQSAGEAGPAGSVLLEPFFNWRKQLRLLAIFRAHSDPHVNGAPAPRVAVLSPGDFFQWAPGFGGFRVALFSKPQVGPPPSAVLGKPCPVCRVPFAATATCVSCLCGVVLHCEPDEKEGLQCAQLRRECPVCKRPVVLTEGYVYPPCHED
jgi:hypothetical protein